MRIARRRSFTMIELLFVVLIIALLVGMLLPAISAVKRAAERTKAATRAQTMVDAIKAYRAQYPTFPGQTQGAADWVYDDSAPARSHAVILMALTNNPRKIYFNDVVENSGTNRYLDPWDRPYVIAIDEDNDGVISNMTSTFGGTTFSTNGVKERVAIMSWGRDPSNPSGWLYSWMR